MDYEIKSIRVDSFVKSTYGYKLMAWKKCDIFLRKNLDIHIKIHFLSRVRIK